MPGTRVPGVEKMENFKLIKKKLTKMSVQDGNSYQAMNRYNKFAGQLTVESTVIRINGLDQNLELFFSVTEQVNSFGKLSYDNADFENEQLVIVDGENLSVNYFCTCERFLINNLCEHSILSLYKYGNDKSAIAILNNDYKLVPIPKQHEEAVLDLIDVFASRRGDVDLVLNLIGQVLNNKKPERDWKNFKVKETVVPKEGSKGKENKKLKPELFYVFESMYHGFKLSLYELKKNQPLSITNLKSYKFKINDSSEYTSSHDQALINYTKLALLDRPATEARYYIGNHIDSIPSDLVDENFSSMLLKTDRVYYLNNNEKLSKIERFLRQKEAEFEIVFKENSHNKNYSIEVIKKLIVNKDDKSTIYGNIYFNDCNAYFLDAAPVFDYLTDAIDYQSITVPFDEVNDFISFFSEDYPDLSFKFDDENIRSNVGELAGIEIAVKLNEDTCELGLFLRYNDGSLHSLLGPSCIFKPDKNEVFYRNKEIEINLKDELEKKIEFSSWDKALDIENGYEIIKKLDYQNVPMSYQSKKLKVAKDFEFKISSGIDWIDLSGGVKFDDLSFIDVIQLKSALKKGNTIDLKSGEVGLLPKVFKRKYRDILDLASTNSKEKKTLKLNSLHAGLFSSETLRELNILPDESFGKKINAIESVHFAKKIKTKVELTDFNGVLRDYQKEGVNWLFKLNESSLNGILADDMGLGKTIQVIAMLGEVSKQKITQNSSLIVVPKSLLHNWYKEILKFSKSLKPVIVDNENQLQDLDTRDPQKIYLITYHYLRSKNNYFENRLFNYLIVDEAQNIKNDKTLIFNTIVTIMAKSKLALTGTPIENTIIDLANIFEFLYPGSMSDGLRSKLINSNQAKFKNENGKDKGLMHLFSEFISPLVLRRTKKSVLKDLPEKIEKNMYLDFNETELKKYNLLKKSIQAAVLDDENSSSELKKRNHYLKIIEGITRLRQGALDFRLLPGEKKNTTLNVSTKITQLVDDLKTVTKEGSRALVFSQFSSFLDLVADELESENLKYSHIDGSTKNRDKEINKFKSNDTSVFLSTLKTGGVGLNLTEAEYVFILDPWWNPAVEAQAIDRAHRIGQKNTVIVIRYIMKDSIEEKVLELQKIKKSLSDEILQLGEEGIFRKLSQRELGDLFT